MIKPSASDKEIMIVTRVTMAAVGVFATLIALFNTSSIVTILMFAFTLRAAGSFFPYVLGHYWKGAFPGQEPCFSDRRNYCCSISGACFQRKSVRSALQSADRTWTGCCVDRIPYLLTGYASKEADNRACT